jgi:HEAT repeat protein
MGFTLITQLFLLVAFVLQNPSLDSVSPKEREAAIEKLAVLGNREALPQLAAALKKEPKGELRAEIVAALGRIGDREAIPVLSDTMRNDLVKDVRAQAIDSLLRLYIPIRESGSVRTMYNRVKSVFQQPNAPVVGPEVQVDASAKEALALTMQKDFEDEIRASAARGLGSLRARDQVPVLISTLEDPQNLEHPKVRVEIVRALGALRDPSSGPTLERALRDPDREVMEQAILAVGLVGDSAARGTLEDIFRKNPNRATKSRALEALALLRDRGSIPLFESLLNDKNDRYRELSAEGLARVEYEGARDWKTRFEEEKRANVQNALAYGLTASGNLDYLNNLANALDSRQSDQAEVYLFELGKFHGKLNELYRYLRSMNPKVRAGVARVVGNIGDPSAIESIRPLTEDPSTEVVREAVDALRKLTR